MRHFISPLSRLVLLSTWLLAVAIGCEKSDEGADGEVRTAESTTPGAEAADPAAAFTEEQVLEIVNAVIEKDAKKVDELLASNPGLVAVKFTSGGPVNGWPLVMIAASAGDKPTVDVLLKHKADVNETNLSSETALIYAASKGHTEIVELLLAHGADVTRKTDTDATALSVAKSAGKTDVVKLLQAKGATE